MRELLSGQLLLAQPWLPGRAGLVPASKKRPAAAAESSTHSSDSAQPCGPAGATSSLVVQPAVAQLISHSNERYLGPLRGSRILQEDIQLCRPSALLIAMVAYQVMRAHKTHSPMRGHQAVNAALK